MKLKLDNSNNSSLDAYMSEYLTLTHELPIGASGDRAWYVSKDCFVVTNLYVFDGAIHVSSIQTLPPDSCSGMGIGSKVMKRLVTMADKHGVSMTLIPKPFGSKKMSASSLKSWYRNLGFRNEVNAGDLWKRTHLAESLAFVSQKRMLREYIREMLKEDAAEFIKTVNRKGVHDPLIQFRNDPKRKSHSREIKRIFRDNADHNWLNTLDTVHWNFETYPEAFLSLKGRNRDEISCTMTMPNKSFEPRNFEAAYGLWVKGRITLASYDQDQIWSGMRGHYMSHPPEPEQLQRMRSSGLNKRPDTLPHKRSWANLEKEMDELGGFDARELGYQFPYILDQQSWVEPSGGFMNEALVDNWRAVGLVVPEYAEMGIKDLQQNFPDIPDSELINDYKQNRHSAAEFTRAAYECMLVAKEMGGISIFNFEKEKIWSASA
jgi:hypothetical protein